MTVKADNKKRVAIPDAHPGDVFVYEPQGNNHFLLTRLSAPPPPKKMTRAQVGSAIAKSKIKFDMTWAELRQLTREP